MKKSLYPASLLLAAAALTGCIFGNSSDALLDPGEKMATIPFTVQGNTLITGPYSDSDAYCDGDVLQTETDTTEADTVGFQITGATLNVFPRKDTMQSGAVLQVAVVFTREGPGTGLEGLWLSIRQEYILVSGTLSEEEKLDQQKDSAFNAQARTFTKSWVRFAGGKLSTYYDVNSAKRFIAYWNLGYPSAFNPDSARYAITLKELDKNTVELKGLKNGETVRRAETSAGTTYTSDKPGHAPHRYFYTPTSCPNEDTPLWYDDFLDANSKGDTGLEKSAEIHPKKGFPQHFPFGPLKTMGSLLN